VIRSFRGKKTELLFAGQDVKEFSGFRKVAERKLTMLNSAFDLKDLLAPAGNRLEKLKGGTVSESTTSGGSVSRGWLTDPMTWRSRIITEWRR
jgi:hypothetical protein